MSDSDRDNDDFSDDESVSENQKRDDLNDDDDDHGHDNEDGDDQEDIEEQRKKKKKSRKEKTEKEERKKKKKVHRLSLTETEDFNAKLKKRGVVYVARIPPKMTPTKIKRLLSDFGEVTRVYLVEEDPSKRKRRKKELGSSGGKRYVEGWVEFGDKKIAKHVAASLNTTPITNHKRDPHYGDLWALKYLSKFSWSHLTEKVAYERRVREQKLRIEMMQARRENAQYVEMVETGKKLDKIEERRSRHANNQQGSSTTGGQKRPPSSGDGGGVTNNGKKQRRNKHHQLKPVRDGGEKANRIVPNLIW